MVRNVMKHKHIALLDNRDTHAQDLGSELGLGTQEGD